MFSDICKIVDGSDADRADHDCNSHDGKAVVDRPNGDKRAPELSLEDLVVTLQAVSNPVM